MTITYGIKPCRDTCCEIRNLNQPKSTFHCTFASALANWRVSMRHMLTTFSVPVTMSSERSVPRHIKCSKQSETIPRHSRFSGFNVSVSDEGSPTFDQNFYRKQYEYLDNASTFPYFKSMRMKLAWLANTRADLQFEISQLAQVTQEMFNKDAMTCVKKLNAAGRYGHDNAASLQFQKLDRTNIRFAKFSDAAHASNHDLTSQLGRILFIMDNSNKSVPILFKSYKSRRVTRSVLL